MQWELITAKSHSLCTPGPWLHGPMQSASFMVPLTQLTPYLVTEIGVRIFAVLFCWTHQSPMTRDLIHPMVHRSEEEGVWIGAPYQVHVWVTGTHMAKLNVDKIGLMIRICSGILTIKPNIKTIIIIASFQCPCVYIYYLIRDNLQIRVLGLQVRTNNVVSN